MSSTPASAAAEATASVDPGSVENSAAGRPVENTRRGRTRDRLMDAAFEVFAERGVHTASVEQITEHAGFTRGAFYSNFSSKEELFFALMQRENRLRIELLEAHTTALVPTIAARTEPLSDGDLGAFIVGFLGTQPDNRQWCLVEQEFRLLAMRDQEVAARFRELGHPFEEQLVSIISAAVAAVGRRFLVEPVEACHVFVRIYENGITDAILDEAHTDETMERMQRTLTTAVVALTASA